MNLYISEVVDILDVGKEGQVTDGERIRARVMPYDRGKAINAIPWAFPLMPKMIHVKPKVGESVLVFTMGELDGGGQRFYIGPIISQPQFMQYDSFIGGSSRLLDNTTLGPEKAPSTDPNTEGSYATNDDVAIYGRRDTDIVLGDEDLLIRCGSRKFSELDGGFVFNKRNPSFIKMKEHRQSLIDGSATSTTIVGDSINLISNNGSPYIDTTGGKNEQITDDEMNKIIEKCHVLPYGDVLIDFLQMFLQMFKAHTHKYPGLPPCPDDTSKQLNMKYGTGTGEYDDTMYDYTRGNSNLRRFEDTSKTFRGLGEKLLSKNIRIN